MWQSVVPTESRVAATSAEFYAQALKRVRVRRHQVQAIAIPFMRLFRALQTGYTFQNPFDQSEPQRVPLDKLREDFVQAVTKYAPEALVDSVIPDRDTYDDVDETEEVMEPDGSVYTPYNIEDFRDADEAQREEIKRLDELLAEEERDAQAEAEYVLKQLGEEYLAKRLKKRAADEGAQEASEQAREEEHAKAGRRVAAHAERMVQNGGRHLRTKVGSNDKRVVGFVRVHKPEGDAHPCGFCALLISRGVWNIYTSKRSASLTGSDFDEYHAGCHCSAEEVYSLDYFNSDSRFDLNRELRDIYDHPEKYLGPGLKWDFSYDDGKNLMPKWRRYFRDRAAQAAAKHKEITPVARRQ